MVDDTWLVFVAIQCLGTGRYSVLLHRNGHLQGLSIFDTHPLELPGHLVHADGASRALHDHLVLDVFDGVRHHEAYLVLLPLVIVLAVLAAPVVHKLLLLVGLIVEVVRTTH